LSPALTVRIYLKPHCSLCEVARDLLHRLRPELGFLLEEVDVTTRPDTWDRYRHVVPVISVDGAEVSRLRVDPPALEARLRGMGVASSTIPGLPREPKT